MRSSSRETREISARPSANTDSTPSARGRPRTRTEIDNRWRRLPAHRRHRTRDSLITREARRRRSWATQARRPTRSESSRTVPRAPASPAPRNRPARSHRIACPLAKACIRTTSRTIAPAFAAAPAATSTPSSAAATPTVARRGTESPPARPPRAPNPPHSRSTRLSAPARTSASPQKPSLPPFRPRALSSLSAAASPSTPRSRRRPAPPHPSSRAPAFQTPPRARAPSAATPTTPPPSLAVASPRRPSFVGGVVSNFQISPRRFKSTRATSSRRAVDPDGGARSRPSGSARSRNLAAIVAIVASSAASSRRATRDVPRREM